MTLSHKGRTMPLNNLRPPRRQSTVEYLAEQLRTAVMTGPISAGAWAKSRGHYPASLRSTRP